MIVRRTVPVVAALLLCASAAFAAGAPTPDLTTSDYKIVTSDSHYNLDTGAFTMPSKVTFYRQGTNGVADRATGNSKNGTVTLAGHVEIHDSGNAPEAATEKAYRGSGPATIWCDQLAVDARAKTYDASGHVRFEQGSRNGTADHALLDRNRGILHMDGNVHLNDNGSTLSANALDYNLNTKDVDIHGAPAVITQPKR
ncbi:MAG: hypothetical protein JOZ86_02010 [Candidatus Eremiobacteraeota bacterium]|nr:hypothetical protein [Candidatus Eremiobacteraeota bacterium]